jgi:hypothetical protein
MALTNPPTTRRLAFRPRAGTLGIGAALLALLFVILNFVVEDAGTLFLILAVVAAAAAGYFLTRDRPRTASSASHSVVREHLNGAAHVQLCGSCPGGRVMYPSQ